MAPMKRLPTSETAAKVEELSPIIAFFSPKAVCGRKKKIRDSPTTVVPNFKNTFLSLRQQLPQQHQSKDTRSYKLHDKTGSKVKG
jgi:hypothetical protein